MWAKLEYNITLFAKREELKDYSEINENLTKKKKGFGSQTWPKKSSLI